MSYFNELSRSSKFFFAMTLVVIAILAYFNFSGSTPVTFDSKKAELIKFADSEKNKEIAKAETAHASGSVMHDQAIKMADEAIRLMKESAYALSWARSCRDANVLGTIDPAVDCDTIAVTDAEEPKASTGTVQTGSVQAVVNDLIPEFVIETPQQELLSEIDRSDSHLAEIAKNLIWKYNARGYAQSPVGLTASGVDDRSKQMLVAYKFDERFRLTKNYGWELFKKVGLRYKIKPEVLLCISKADSSLGRVLKTENNIGNVGNDDRGRTMTFDTIGAGIDHIGKTLTNKNLGHKQSIGSLHPVSGGDQPFYATGKGGEWYFNVRNCLAEIHNDVSINPDWMFRNQSKIN